jgi:hypothetical protein
VPGGLSYARGDIALVLTAAGAGTVTSGSLANAGEASVVLAAVHLTALTGTTPTVTLSLEQSANGSSGWTAIPGASAAQLTAAGSATVTAVATANYVRASVVIGGTTPAATGAVPIIVFAD